MNAPLTLNSGKELTAGQWQPTKVMHWYDGIIDVMITNPGISHKEIAALLGRSPVTIGLIVRSDLFNARYAERRAQYDKSLHERMAAKIAGVAEKSLDLTMKVLERQQDKVPLETLVDINSKTLAMLGYGPQGSPTNIHIGVNQQNNTASVAPNDLARAREALRDRERGLMVESTVQALGGPGPEERGRG